MLITVCPNEVIYQIIDVIGVVDGLTDISLGHLVGDLFLVVITTCWLLLLNAVSNAEITR